MRIDLQFGNTEAIGAHKAGHDARPERATWSGNGDDEARLAGSDRISSLKASVLAAPEIRSERVQALRAAIADGSYSVQPQSVADAMVRELF